MTIKEFLKGYRDEVVIPSIVACAIICPYLVGNAIFADYVGRTIGEQPSCNLMVNPYCNVSVTDIDTDGNGSLDTRVTVIPRAGVVRERISP